MPAMPKHRPKYLQRDFSRHNKPRWYVRVGRGKRVRINHEYDTPEFWHAYRMAVEQRSRAGAETRAVGGQTLQLAWDRYRQSSAWAVLKHTTRRQRENIMRPIIEAEGSAPLSSVDAQAIRSGRERRKDTPHQANSFLKLMRTFFAWCFEENLVTSDPTAGVKMLAGDNDAHGFHTWTNEELERFERYWAVGTRERLAYDLLLYTGLRRGDAVRVGRQHVSDGVITIETEKQNRRSKERIVVSIPILPPLAESITATRTGDMVFLVNERGLPWVKESFGNWFGDVCREAKCPGAAHGLRKAGAARAAEHGATEKQLMAMYGWTTGKQAAHYTRAADRKRLAHDAAQLLLPAQAKNKNALTSHAVRAKTRKASANQEGKK